MSPERELTQNFELGPFLQAALICETVIEDKTGMVSAIKILDRVTHTVQGPNLPLEMPPFDHEFYMLVVLKSGENPGVFQLTMQPIKPTNERLPQMSYSINLEAPADRGMNVIARVKMRLDVQGLWWFDIGLNGQRITRIPLRVIYLPQQVRIPQ